MAKLRLLGSQVEIVHGTIICADPPDKLCKLVAANGDVIASRIMQESDAKAWAIRECEACVTRCGIDEAKRLGYDKPMELRIYDLR